VWWRLLSLRHARRVNLDEARCVLAALVFILGDHRDEQARPPGLFDDGAQVSLAAVEMKSMAAFGLEKKALEVAEIIENEPFYLTDKPAFAMTMAAAWRRIRDAPPIAAARGEDGLRITAVVLNLEWKVHPRKSARQRIARDVEGRVRSGLAAGFRAGPEGRVRDRSWP
jgi:hypothetical protein